MGGSKKMGKLNIKIKKDLDKKFREAVFKRKGMKKGNLTEAIEEAMLLWIEVPPENGEEFHKR